MDFELSDEQRTIRDTLRQFAEREIKPHSAKWDKEEIFPREVDRAISASWASSASPFPSASAAAAPTRSSQALVVEGLSRYDASVGLTCAAHMSLSTGHSDGVRIRRSGRNHYVPEMLAGEEARRVVPDRAEFRFRCGRDAYEGDPHRRQLFEITGSKMFITNGRVADVYVVMAITDPGRGPRGVSAFIVDRGRGSRTEGKSKSRTARVRHRRGDFRKRQSRRATWSASLARATGRRSRCSRPGESDRRIAAGIARGGFEEARAYALERGQFGKKIARASRRSSGCSPTWRRESTRRGCSSVAPRPSRMRASRSSARSGDGEAVRV